MGSFTRVNVYYEDLDNFFKTSDLKVIGTSSNTKIILKKIDLLMVLFYLEMSHTV